MLHIFGYLKRSWKSVAVIIVLLVLQASCDLTLPQYTSNLVDVGIQQSASYVFKGFGNVDFGNLAFTFEDFETAFKSVTKIFKHIYFLFFLL